MTVYRFIGDVHGRYQKYSELIKCEYPTIQVGDFGQGFSPAPIMAEKDRFIRGNHDNPAICKQNPHWIKDGHIENGMLFIGGAWSIDHASRTPGVDWWDDEELSYSELSIMIDLAIANQPLVIVSHEAPTTAIPKYAGFRNKEPSRTSSAFDVIFEKVRPKLWVFGHYHRPWNFVEQGTRFICCDIDTAVDVEVG